MTHNPYKGVTRFLDPGFNYEQYYAVVTVNEPNKLTYASFFCEHTQPPPEGGPTDPLYEGMTINEMWDTTQSAANAAFWTEFTTQSIYDNMNIGVSDFTPNIYFTNLLRFRFVENGLIYRYAGKTTLSLNSTLIGDNELDDIVFFDFPVDKDGRIYGGRNMYAQSSIIKAFAPRIYALENLRSMFTVFIPAKTANLSDCSFLIREAVVGDNIQINLPDTSVVSPFTVDNSLFSPPRMLNIITPATLTVPSGELAVIPVTLQWKDGSTFDTPVELWVDSNQGFIPNAHLLLNNQGQGYVRIIALDLAVGENIHLKIGNNHYTTIGEFDITVV